MDCRKIHQVYADFIKGKLSPDEMSWIEDHVKDCPDCYLFNSQFRKDFLKENMISEDESPGE